MTSPEAPKETAGKPHAILIVEDHDRTREVIRDWLSFVFPGWLLFEARSGEEALGLVPAFQPDMILTG
jgi:CheY-like chemotaxis protein